MKSKPNTDIKTPELRIAIISDPHIGFLGHINPNYYGLGLLGNQSLWFEYALRWFREKGVDAIVVPGDMANACAYKGIYDGMTSADCAVKEMAQMGEIFRRVFAGTDTRLVTIYGNHDNLCQGRERLNGGESSPWEEAFGEPYAHINIKEVNGFTFIGANWGYEAEARDIIKAKARENPDKPIFYIQHGEIAGTTCDTHRGKESLVGINNVRDFDNVIALFGHTHCPITDERTIWQSEKEGAPKCTVISCSTFNYGDSTGDLLRGENLMTKHALYLTVLGKDVNVERLSFWTEEMLALAEGKKTEQNFSLCTKSAGADWHFTIGGERVMDFERRAALATAPEFPVGAVAGLSRSDTFAVVFFPAAIPLECDNDLIHSYYAEAYDFETGELVSHGQISTEFHVDHTSDYYTPYYQIVLADLKPDTKYTVKVYARDCWQKLSTRPLIHIGKTLPAKRERLY